MKIVVGCPVRAREWVAEAYVNHAAWATIEAGIKDEDVTLMFVSHPDDPTNEVLAQTAELFGMECIFIPDEEDGPDEIPRFWGPERLQMMVRVRNKLLQGVRAREPDLFLSLDSDILINSKAIRCMARLLHATGGRDKHTHPSAVSHCVYLHELSKSFPNYAMLTSRGNMRRSEHEGTLMPVDVIMAAKLMKPEAYNVDYEYDRRGEDIGWSTAVRRQGMHLAWTGKTVSKHCMKRSHLDSKDPRCGY